MNPWLAAAVGSTIGFVIGSVVGAFGVIAVWNYSSGPHQVQGHVEKGHR